MKIQTKDKIFDVALDLFSKKGYDSVSIRTIASEVGIKESSIYNHYSSKKEILMSILKYFEEYFQGNPLDDENVRKLLEKTLKSSIIRDRKCLNSRFSKKRF